MNSRLVVVTGATGTQGGAVLRALVAGGRFRVRAINRRPTSSAAQRLVDQGVEVVQATLESRESLIKAFDSAYAVYGCTPFGDSTEEQQGKNIVDACKANQVPLLVWSSLPSAFETSGGKYVNMSHYDRKHEVNRYLQDSEQPSVTIYTGAFSDNLVNYRWMSRAGDGTFDINIPVSLRAAIPYTWVNGDLGGAVHAIIDNWDKREARTELQEQQPIHVCSYRITGAQMAESVSRITRVPARFTGSRSTGTGELAEMFQYQDDGMLHADAAIPPPVLKKLGVEFHTFDDFVRADILPRSK